MSYDPKSKIRNFLFDQDFETLRSDCLMNGKRFEDPIFNMDNEGEGESRCPGEICGSPHFINGRPRKIDALQGKGADCWVVAAMEVLTFRLDLLYHVVPPNQNFTDNYCGIFHFRIWQLGTWYDVVVDDRLPVFKDNTNSLIYCHSKFHDVFWAALLEKAYAKVLSLRTKWEVGYQWIIKSSDPQNSLQDFTGGIVEHLPTPSNPITQHAKATGGVVTMSSWWFKLNDLFEDRALVTCQYTSPKVDSKGLYPKHTYAVTQIFRCPDDDPDYPGLFLVRLFNPWGSKEWTGGFSDDDYTMWRQFDSDLKRKIGVKSEDDGEFWMSEEDFLNYFETVFVCHLSPGQYLHSYRAGVSIQDWTTIALRGEWVPGVSAGGSDKSTRLRNPQFLLTVNKKVLSSSDPYNIVIELVQHYAIHEKDKPAIGVYVYPLEDSMNLPINELTLHLIEPIKEDIQFDGRSFVTELRLCNGRYLLLPATLNPNKEAQFMIRVYFKSLTMDFEGGDSDKISKSSPTTEEESRHESDESLKILFTDVSQGRGEIDWTGLKEILDTAMNQLVSDKRSELNAVALIFNFFSDNFNKYFPNSRNDCETEDVTFTKDECRRMIAMLDENHSGELSFSECCNLWNKIKFWTKVYKQYRDETEGFVSISQLQDALSSIGYNVNKRTIHSLSYMYMNEKRHIILTDFILCGVALETALTLFQKAGVEGEKKIIITLEEWVKNTLNL